MSDCIEWRGTRDKDGYGKVGARRAHRIAWEAAHGPIPEGLHVLHRCDNPPCVNIDHLFLGTHTDNMRDAFKKGRAGAALLAARTQCVHGHPYDDMNTYRRPNGQRDCRACIRARAARYQAKQRARAA